MCPEQTPSVHGCNSWPFTFLSFSPFLSLILGLSQKGWLCSGRGRGEARAASLAKAKFWAADWHWLCVLHPLPCLLHEVFSHFIAMDNPPKSVSSFHLLCSSIKLWTVQKVSGLHWEHLSKLQTEDFILKSAFTYMWVTMAVKSLQSNNAIS